MCNSNDSIFCLVKLTSPSYFSHSKKRFSTEKMMGWSCLWNTDVCSNVSLLFHGSKKFTYLFSWLCRKQCVQTFNVFDFLKDIVGKVPDLGGAVATGDDQTITKRRFVFG